MTGLFLLPAFFSAVSSPVGICQVWPFQVSLAGQSLPWGRLMLRREFSLVMQSDGFCSELYLFYDKDTGPAEVPLIVLVLESFVEVM